MFINPGQQVVLVLADVIDVFVAVVLVQNPDTSKIDIRCLLACLCCAWNEFQQLGPKVSAVCAPQVDEDAS